ncbi:MAG: hypothetical protein ACYS0G_08890 [Planctomycetota bacterium]|jgi:hypothetical protein
MKFARGAILAVMGTVAAAGPLPEPLHVRFQLADGVWVAGDMSAWDAEGFEGSFGRRLWLELMAEDVWRLYQRVIDPDDAGQWVDLGRLLLIVPDGESWAQRAFRRALDVDSSSAALIDAARREAAEARGRRKERRRASEAQRLRTLTPEAHSWPADPWPSLQTEERVAAVLEMKADARQILSRAGMQIEPIETSYVLMYSDLPRLAAAGLAGQLDTVCERLGGITRLAEGENVFWGKAVVLIFRDRDRFRLVEAEAFDQLVPAEAVGICHPVGPKVFLNFYSAADEQALAEAVSHELVHAFMHRYQTPRRLPAWANEGFAEYVAARISDESQGSQERRRQALAFIRANGNVQVVLDMTYADRSRPGSEEVRDTVGSLLVELMIAENPAGFVAWIKAVKGGKDWETALTEDFGVPRGRLVETFVRYYRVND